MKEEKQSAMRCSCMLCQRIDGTWGKLTAILARAQFAAAVKEIGGVVESGGRVTRRKN